MTDRRTTIDDVLKPCTVGEQVFVFRMAASVLGVVAGEAGSRSRIDSQFSHRIAERVFGAVSESLALRKAALQLGIGESRRYELTEIARGVYPMLIKPEVMLGVHARASRRTIAARS